MQFYSIQNAFVNELLSVAPSPEFIQYAEEQIIEMAKKLNEHPAALANKIGLHLSASLFHYAYNGDIDLMEAGPMFIDRNAYNEWKQSDAYRAYKERRRLEAAGITTKKRGRPPKRQS
ncbi:MAG: hypothetical protein EPO24_15945 [Bacteroidetes bacterium]|nr:MAG: hypothetical protein EPO24_15945 [Bacteroidota bacterium]